MSREHEQKEIERVQVLEHRAAATRERLVRAVEALDARRRQVVQIGTRAKALAVPAALSVLVVAGLFGASVLIFGLAWRKRRSRAFGERVRRSLSGLQLARPSLGRVVVEKAVVTLVAILTSEVGRRASKNFFDGRYPDGRLAAGRLLAQRERAATSRA